MGLLSIIPSLLSLTITTMFRKNKKLLTIIKRWEKQRIDKHKEP